MSQRLIFDKFNGAYMKYDNCLLKFQPKNTQLRHFRSQIQVFLLFRKILQLDKFEGANFKYDNSILKFLSQKYPNKDFLNKNIQIRHFCSQLQAVLFFREIRDWTDSRVLISNLTIVFLNILPKNTQIKHFQSKIPKQGIFDPKFRHFYFLTKFCSQTNLKVLVSNIKITF